VKANLILCGCLLLATRVSAQTLIHYYEFTSAVTDLAGTANGTLTNGASISGGKLVLDGVNDYVSFSTKLVPTSGNFSVALFAQATGLGNFSFVELISQGSSSAPGFYIGYDTSHNFRLGDSLTSTGIAFPTDAQSHHYALTMDGTNTRFYIDGSLVGTFGAIGVAGTDNTRLGAQFETYTEYFYGSIDEVRIYSGALSGAQVAALVAIPEPSATVAMLAAATLGAAATTLRRRIAR
jgi:hypothetical protein